jgi:hypothetical protein
VAASVNRDGTVTADNHDSARSGWASLSFDAVNATGIRIGFSNVTSLSQNHYRVSRVRSLWRPVARLSPRPFESYLGAILVTPSFH